jgi:hypothetical protein
MLCFRIDVNLFYVGPPRAFSLGNIRGNRVSNRVHNRLSGGAVPVRSIEALLYRGPPRRLDALWACYNRRREAFDQHD